MSGRSLSCSPEGIQKAKKALIRYSLTQKALAYELEVTRQPVGKFFTGKPVDRNLFVRICDRLDLEWEAIVVEAEVNQDHSINIDALVKEVREKIKPLIQERCGTMRVLDMTQPIELNDIYTSVNILEKITGRQRLGIDQLLQQCTSEDFDRFGLSNVTEKRVLGIKAVEKYPKLMILGKPGAGKTTFLKYLAMECIESKFQSNCVPMFIALKDFAEAANKPTLLELIIKVVRQVFRLPLMNSSHNTHQSQGQDACTTNTEQLLSQGRILILLDGLDEVREEDSNRILNEIDRFSERFYKNNFVMTCRIAAREYTFEKFTEVEVADFDNEQIASFARKWFKGKFVKAESFIKRLKDNQQIQELATNPLLLTLLCLVFEESGDFPANRSELYKEGLDALLKKWDAKRGIQRDHVYKKLSVQRKEDLLSKIALNTFERGDYFFKQKEAEQYIIEYIRNLADVDIDPEILQLDSERVLKSIEYQHGLLVERAKGIYSFSHLTFHEYFTAREFVIGRHSSVEAFKNLVSHITEKRWREVLLLAVGMSPSADYLLQFMKKQVDGIIADDNNLQHFLMWVNTKSTSVQVNYTPGVVRSFYFFCSTSDCLPYNVDLLNTSFNIDFNSTIGMAYNAIVQNVENLVTTITNEIDSFTENDLIFDCVLDYCLSVNLKEIGFIKNVYTIACFLSRIRGLKRDRELQRLLQELQRQMPDLDRDKKKFDKWCQYNSQDWIKQLRKIINKYRNIGYDWQFSYEQKELLNQYYNANRILISCLNSDCYVSREVREQIEDTLLLPIAEIKQRQQLS